MEGVPRIPMLGFPTKRSADNPDFRTKIRKHIHQHYNEDPDAYSQEVSAFENLRAAAIHASRDFTGCATLKKYFCQLHFLKSRFPFQEGGQAAISFSWYDVYTDTVHGWKDIEFEMSCILYNIGALHSELGTQDARITADGMKTSCTHFQCAAWAFQQLKNDYNKFFSPDLSADVLNIMNNICLAQAQECILEKSLVDNRKFAITAKIALQIVEYYQQTLRLIENIQRKTSQTPSDKVMKAVKKWREVVETKIHYYGCLSYMYRGLHSEELSKYGERITFFKASAEKLADSIKTAKSLEKGEFSAIFETLNFTNDVITTKLASSEKENEFVYHEKVPELASVDIDFKGVSLVKGIPFRFDDPEISGPDIFSRLIPMAAHEASSLYSEEKAKILRTYSAKVEEKNQVIEQFLLALQLEQLDIHTEENHVPQELIDCCAALSANPEAVKKLSDLMSKLSGMFHDVEHNLKEIQEVLKTEEEKEKEFQEIVGKRPPNNLITELSREVKKYQQAHTVASESNQTLHDAMRVHVVNLQVLMKPFPEVLKQIPSIADIEEKDEAAIHEMKRLRAKIAEMRIQRETLFSNLRESILGDDITKSLVVKQDQDRDVVFAEELKKHEKITQILDQNLLAQENIIRAVTEANAAYASTRRATEEIIKKRNVAIQNLVGSHDAYNELLLKCTQGIEFYIKLDTNVSKLLQRVRSACKVQEEEREDRTSAILKHQQPSTTAVQDNFSKEMPKLPGTSQQLPNSFSNYQTNYQTDPVSMDNTALQQQYEKNLALQQQYEKNLALQQEYEKLNRLQHILSKETNMSYSPNNYNTMTYANDPNVKNTYVVPSTVSASYPVPSQSTAYYAQPSNPNPNQQQQQYMPTHAPVNGSNSVPTQYMPSASYSNPANQGYGSNGTMNAALTMSYGSNNSSHPQTFTTNSAGDQSYSSIVSAGVDQQPAPTIQNYPSVTPEAYHPNVDSSIGANPYSHNPLLQQYSQQYGGPSAQQPQSVNSFGSYPILQQYTKAPEACTRGTYSDTYSNPYGKNLAMGQYSSPMPLPAENQQYDQQSYGVNLTGNTPAVSNTYAQQSNNAATSVVAGIPHYQVNPEMGSGLPQQNTGGYSQPTAPPQTYTGYIAGTNSYMNYYNQPPESQPPPAQYQTAPLQHQQQAMPQQTSGSGAVYSNQTMYAAGTGENIVNQNNSYGNNSAPSPQIAPVHIPASSYQPPQLNPEIRSNIDLLSEVDLSLPQPPLQPLTSSSGPPFSGQVQPLQHSTHQTPANVEASKAPLATSGSGALDAGNNVNSIPSGSLPLKIPTSPEARKPLNDPLSDPIALERFTKDVENLEHTVENFSKKSLNGPTNIDMKWKEVVDIQNAASIKMSISVARCYPMKNRYPDILPHDQTRVPLPCTKDDYINASFVREISPTAIPFIATQAPLPVTYSDFWHMIWHHYVELIVCLVPENDLKAHIYWPLERGKDLEFGPLVISLQSKNVKPSFTERIFSITHRVMKSTRVAIHLHFTGWPGNVFPDSPGPLLGFITEMHNYFQQQRSLSRPVLLHCLAGVGKTGVVTVLSSAIREIQNGKCFPDLTSFAGLASEQRKGVMNDKEYLRFAYQCLLYYCQDLLMKRGILSARVSFDDKPKSHTRHPSQDFLTDAVRKIVSTAKSSEERDESSLQPSSLEPESPVPVGLNGHKFVSSRAEIFADVPPSLMNIELSTFQKPEVKESELKRLDFSNRKGALAKSSDMPLDPLSSLDPLWTMKK